MTPFQAGLGLILMLTAVYACAIALRHVEQPFAARIIWFGTGGWSTALNLLPLVTAGWMQSYLPALRANADVDQFHVGLFYGWLLTGPGIIITGLAVLGVKSLDARVLAKRMTQPKPSSS